MRTTAFATECLGADDMTRTSALWRTTEDDRTDDDDEGDFDDEDDGRRTRLFFDVDDKPTNL